jgi:hypothetical protein
VQVTTDVRTGAIRILREAAAQPDVLNTYEGIASLIGYDPKGAEVALAIAAYTFVADADEDDVAAEDARAAELLARGWTPRVPARERA